MKRTENQNRNEAQYHEDDFAFVEPDRMPAPQSSRSWRDDFPPPHRKSRAPLIFFLLIILLSLSVTLFLYEYERGMKPVIQGQIQQKQSTSESINGEIVPPLSGTISEAEQTLKNTNTIPQPITSNDPHDIIIAIGNALAQNDITSAERLIGEQALTDESRQKLRSLFTSQNFKLRQPDAVREVGELEINQRTRISLELANQENGRERIYFDLAKVNGIWKIEKITLPSGVGEMLQPSSTLDALGVADAFLLAALAQNFSQAKKFVNSASVSDATIAGLCILFEEGNYQLRQTKPIRATIQKETVATFLVNVVALNHAQPAQFGISLRRENLAGMWIINELNLDQLLSDYASRVAGGDVYYTPLIKNPNGGDTLVLYFDFDTNELTPRTKRQLSIVAMLLQNDQRKKINLSGHTDSLGSREYNQLLSGKRALVVRDFLVASGVKSSQIDTAAKGLTEPRRPNLTEAGQDDPDGRRANRRTEIYLDF